MHLAAAVSTNDDPVAAGVGFTVIGMAMLLFTAVGRWRRWRVFDPEGSWSLRAAVLQGAGALAVGLGFLAYSAATG